MSSTQYLPICLKPPHTHTETQIHFVQKFIQCFEQILCASNCVWHYYAYVHILCPY